MTPPGWGTGPACYLVNSSSISTTSVTVQVPASVGPSGSQYYSISYMQFNTDPNSEYSSSGFGYSSTFTFSGGTGAWSDYEKSGHSVFSADDLPCTAYDCARQCLQKYYPADVSEDDMTGYKSAYGCYKACPGVSVPSWDDVISGGENGGDSSTVTGMVTANGGVSSTVSVQSVTKTASTTLSTATGTTATQSTANASNASKTSSGSAGASIVGSSAASSTATHTSGSRQNYAATVSVFASSVFAIIVMSGL
jgi:hypothetical protein